MHFKQIITPDEHEYFIPDDVSLIIPTSNQVLKNDLHFLAYIPWEDKYLKSTPDEYKHFFHEVLPKLSKRTTNVHTAICLSLLRELIENIKLNERVLAISLILHDVGWDDLSDLEIANSLGVKGVLNLSKASLSPKIKHAQKGEKASKKILDTYLFSPPLSNEEKELILKSIRLHDTPWEIKTNGTTPLEVKYLADLDHLWSYTHENFWQDTVRKGVHPTQYIKNLKNDLSEYFITKKGQQKAKELLNQRKAELILQERYIKNI